jgi:hypothetical protein
VLNDQYLLPESLVEHRVDIAPINGTHLQPNKKWSTPAYTTYRTAGHRPPIGGTAEAATLSTHHNKANLTHFTEVQVSSKYPNQGWDSYSRRCISYTQATIPRARSHNTDPELTNITQSIICGNFLWKTPGAKYCYDHALRHNYVWNHRSAHSYSFSNNFNHQPDVLDKTVIRTWAMPIFIESAEALNSD